MSKQILEALSGKLDETQSSLSRMDQYYEGRQPAAFLSPTSKEALGNRLHVLGVNFPRLLVQSLAERLRLTGFRQVGADTADAALWNTWQANDLETQAHLAHIDALTYGRSFVIVWAGPDGKPRVTVESAKQMAVVHDPASGVVRAALKRWEDGKQHHAVVYEPDVITRYAGAESAMKVVETIPNPLGEVPVVPIVNRVRLLDFDGASEMTDILDLTDGLNKIMSDALVTSEYFARPRRWVTGLEVHEDDDGNPVNPFSNEANRVWQSEDPETKFGQFDQARLDGYGDLTATLTQQIGAISGLPPHYLGLNGDQPPSADAIRSAEASLVAKVMGKQRTFGKSWARVAELIDVVQGDRHREMEALWASPETRTPGQLADAALKLSQLGVPLSSILADPLGYTPSQIEQVLRAQRQSLLTQSTADLTRLLIEETTEAVTA